ncbi:hypothetical protein VTK56DRAFT_10111 [Thermocarpiscus australiensis]
MGPFSQAASFLVLAASVAAFTPLEGRPRNTRPDTSATVTEHRDHANRLGWSPKLTDAPRPRGAEMELLRRDFTMGTDNCGSVAGYSSIAITRLEQSASCANDGRGNMDGCTGEHSPCNELHVFGLPRLLRVRTHPPRTIC